MIACFYFLPLLPVSAANNKDNSARAVHLVLELIIIITQNIWNRVV